MRSPLHHRYSGSWRSFCGQAFRATLILGVGFLLTGQFIETSHAQAPETPAPQGLEEQERAIGELVEEGPLLGSDSVLIPADERHFFRAGEGSPSFAMIEADQSGWVQSGVLNSVYKPVSALSVMAPLCMFGIAGLLFFTTLALSLVVPAGRALRLWKAGLPWKLWMWPSLACMSMLWMGACLVLGADEAIVNFSTPTLLARNVQVAAGIGTLCTLLGLGASVRSKVAPPLLRAYVALSCLSLLGCRLWAAGHGWLDVAVWDYVPRVVGG